MVFPESQKSKGKLILIIDDDEDDRDLFKDAVNEIDATLRCVSANNGEEALNLLKTGVELPDFIFLDLNMPRLNGVQCLKQIKKNKKFNNIPVIIYSTTQRAEDIEETKKLGAALFLTKPTVFTKICLAISSIINMDQTGTIFN